MATVLLALAVFGGRQSENPARWLSQLAQRSGVTGRVEEKTLGGGFYYRGELAELAKEVIFQPPGVIERMKRLLGN